MKSGAGAVVLNLCGSYKDRQRSSKQEDETMSTTGRLEEVF